MGAIGASKLGSTATQIAPAPLVEVIMQVPMAPRSSAISDSSANAEAAPTLARVLVMLADAFLVACPCTTVLLKPARQGSPPSAWYSAGFSARFGLATRAESVRSCRLKSAASRFPTDH